jgi:hypothetical protein
VQIALTRRARVQTVKSIAVVVVLLDVMRLHLLFMAVAATAAFAAGCQTEHSDNQCERKTDRFHRQYSSKVSANPSLPEILGIVEPGWKAVIRPPGGLYGTEP